MDFMEKISPSEDERRSNVKLGYVTLNEFHVLHGKLKYKTVSHCLLHHAAVKYQSFKICLHFNDSNLWLVSNVYIYYTCPFRSTDRPLLCSDIKLWPLTFDPFTEACRLSGSHYSVTTKEMGSVAKMYLSVCYSVLSVHYTRRTR
jgi:hypothetical protein